MVKLSDQWNLTRADRETGNFGDTFWPKERGLAPEPREQETWSMIANNGSQIAETSRPHKGCEGIGTNGQALSGDFSPERRIEPDSRESALCGLI